MLLKLGILPVMHGTPPYGLYEHPARSEMIPPHRTDTGAFLIAEVLGAKSCIIGKNVDGLYTEDPLKNPDAELIRDITAKELIRMDLEDLVLEPMVVDSCRMRSISGKCGSSTATSGAISKRRSTGKMSGQLSGQNRKIPDKM